MSECECGDRQTCEMQIGLCLACASIAISLQEHTKMTCAVDMIAVSKPVVNVRSMRLVIMALVLLKSVRLRNNRNIREEARKMSCIAEKLPNIMVINRMGVSSDQDSIFKLEDISQSET